LDEVESFKKKEKYHDPIYSFCNRTMDNFTVSKKQALNLIRVDQKFNMAWALTDENWENIPYDLFNYKKLTFMGEDEIFKYYIRTK